LGCFVRGYAARTAPASQIVEMLQKK
jgi:hypothetical protein